MSTSRTVIVTELIRSPEIGAEDHLEFSPGVNVLVGPPNKSVCPHCGASEEGRSMFANWTCDSWLSTAGEVWQSPACTIRVAKAEIERLKVELDLAGDGDTWRVACKRCEQEIERLSRERDEREQAARQLYNLWPAEHFGTLTGIVDDHSWLENPRLAECRRTYLGNLT